MGLIDGTGAWHLVLVVEQIAGMMDHERDGLGHIDGRSPTDGDDGIRPVRPVGRDPGGDLRLDRVSPHPRKHGGGQAPVIQDLGRRRDGAQRRQALVGDDQRPRAAQLLECPGDQPQRARPVLNPGGKVVLLERHGQLLVRGSFLR